MKTQTKEELGIACLFFLLVAGSLAILVAFDTLIVLYQHFSALTGIKIDLRHFID